MSSRINKKKGPPVIVNFEEGIKEIHFDLLSPCAECPFRSDTPLYPGLINTFQELAVSIMAGTMTHSCHRTDPRSDYEPAKNYNGKLQHCAGALIMLAKTGEISRTAEQAYAAGRFKLSKLNMKAPVMSVSQLAHRITAHVHEQYPDVKL